MGSYTSLRGVNSYSLIAILSFAGPLDIRIKITKALHGYYCISLSTCPWYTNSAPSC